MMDLSCSLYLKKAIPNVYEQCVSKFRMSSDKLEVEHGRYYNVVKNQRICKMCSKSEIEDEFHFLLVRPCYNNFRKMYIKKYYYKKPSTYKLFQLLSTENVTDLYTYLNVQEYEVKIFNSSEFILSIDFIVFCTIIISYHTITIFMIVIK
jgi:hypothetical protein